MSQRQVSIKIERKCEGCGKVTQYELNGPSEDTIKALQAWYTIVKEFWDGREFQKMMVQACSKPCMSAATEKLTLIEQAEESTDTIDLASLQTDNIIGQN